MNFQNPNILYTLLALLIPIIVHLFQLRKFQKTPFTNVKLLKELSLQTRKSSKIKKWLVLMMRLLAFTCIILAFAQPYFDKENINQKVKETVIYIDNSFSMKEKGEKGELLRISIQELLENFNNQEQVSVITNTKTFKNTNLSVIKNELINLDYTTKQLSYKTANLKASKLFNTQENSLKQLIYISDFQQNSNIDSTYYSKKYSTSLIQVLPVSKQNISIDSAYFKLKNTNTIQLNVVVTNQQQRLKNIPISLFNNDSLISKTSVALRQFKNTIQFDLPTQESLNLKVEIQEPYFKHDNTFYISRGKPAKQKVLTIGSAINNKFLTKIFTDDEFLLTQNENSAINYSNFNTQHLIILNEINTISEALIQNIKSFSEKGGIVICIPALNVNPKIYNQLTPVFSTETSIKTRLTKINFSHPILKNVFEKRITNFQFPTFNKHYHLKGYQSVILSFENGNPFLVHQPNYFMFSGSLSAENSNIKLSPLIVPTLYNIAKSSLKTSVSYHAVGVQNKIDIPIQLEQNEILQIQKGKFNYIPLQQIKGNKVSIETFEKPNTSGIYNVVSKNKKIKKLAYNYGKKESTIQYYNTKPLANSHINSSDSVPNRITELNLMSQVTSVWKWFIIFALVFLLFELLILKFFK